MAEPDELKARIDAARATGQPAAKPRGFNRNASGVAAALTHSFGMAIALGLGGLIGYTIDSLAGTGPWALLIFLVFGMVAGFLNLIRAARQMAEDAAAQYEAAQGGPGSTGHGSEHG
ncbi:MAG: AtpZ/AtpI family protein [Pseudomonadota bacterium]